MRVSQTLISTPDRVVFLPIFRVEAFPSPAPGFILPFAAPQVAGDEDLRSFSVYTMPRGCFPISVPQLPRG